MKFPPEFDKKVCAVMFLHAFSPCASFQALTVVTMQVNSQKIRWADPWAPTAECSLSRWIKQRVTQLLGVEDDVVSEMIINFLQEVRTTLTRSRLPAHSDPMRVMSTPMRYSRQQPEGRSCFRGLLKEEGVIPR